MRGQMIAGIAKAFLEGQPSHASLKTRSSEVICGHLVNRRKVTSGNERQLALSAAAAKAAQSL